MMTAAVTKDSVGSFGVPSRFFLYGLPKKNTGMTGRVLQAGTISQTTGKPTLTTLSTELTGVPLMSPDGQTLAFVTTHGVPRALSVGVHFTDVHGGTGLTSQHFPLPTLPPETQVLATPVFTSDAKTLCVVLSIMEKTGPRPFVKKGTSYGPGPLSLTSSTLVVHHELLYFHRETSQFIGPFDLHDAPSLARVNVAADAANIYLWTLTEPASLKRHKGDGKSWPDVQLSIYPIGSGIPTMSMAVPGPWPVNDEPTAVLASGDVVRLGEGRTLYVHSTTTGETAARPIPELARPSSKSGPTTLTMTPQGTLVVSSAALGRVVALKPTGGGFETTSVVSYQRSKYLGGPVRKAVLSGDGNTVYVLGGPQSKGITAYDINTGAIKATVGQAQAAQYVGLSVLPTQEVLAVKTTAPEVTILNPDLTKAAGATVETPIHIVEVF